MEGYFSLYKSSIQTLFSELNQYSPTKGIQKFFELFENPDFDNSKLIGMIHYAINKDNREELLLKRNPELFKNQVKLFPGVYLNKIFPELNDEQQDRVFLLLTHTYAIVELMFQESQKTPMEEKKRANINKMLTYLENNDLQIKKEFNPYEGIESDSTENFGISDIYSENNSLPQSAVEKSSLMPVDMAKLKEELANMTSEDIEAATNNIKNMIPNMDKDSGKVLNSMLSNIKDELADFEFDESNPFQKIEEIANKVSSKLKQDKNAKNINWKKMMDSTQDMVKNFKTGNGQVDEQMLNMATMMMKNPDMMKNLQKFNGK